MGTATVQTVDAVIPRVFMGLDCGPDTIKLNAATIAASNIIIWNGPMGVFEVASFKAGTKTMMDLLLPFSCSSRTCFTPMPPGAPRECSVNHQQSHPPAHLLHASRMPINAPPTHTPPPAYAKVRFTCPLVCNTMRVRGYRPYRRYPSTRRGKQPLTGGAPSLPLYGAIREVSFRASQGACIRLTLIRMEVRLTCPMARVTERLGGSRSVRCETPVGVSPQHAR